MGTKGGSVSGVVYKLGERGRGISTDLLVLWICWGDGSRLVFLVSTGSLASELVSAVGFIQSLLTNVLLEHMLSQSDRGKPTTTADWDVVVTRQVVARSSLQGTPVGPSPPGSTQPWYTSQIHRSLWNVRISEGSGCGSDPHIAF